MPNKRAGDGGDEGAAVPTSRSSLDRARRRAVYMSLDRAEQVEQIAVGHAEDEDEHAGHEQRPQRGEQAASTAS